MKPARIWANLPVKDVKRTAEFYSKLGFKSNMSKESDELTSFLFGSDNFIIHFFAEERLAKAMNGKVADTSQGNEIIFSLSAETSEEVHAWAKLAKDAGGTIFREPSADENGYFYCVFADPDGHKFNVLLVPYGM